MRSLGFVGMSIDIAYDEMLFDILTPLGFCIMLAAVWRLRRHGVLLLAPPCSSWVWMSMGSSKRRKQSEDGAAADLWKGDPENHRIKSQNRFISRIACVIELCRRRKVHHILEQPKTSLMFEHLRLNKARRRNKKVHLIPIMQGAFGSDSAKETYLLTDIEMPGADKKLSMLDKAAIADHKESGYEVSKSYIDKHGKKRTTGGRNLKDSQDYPFGFSCFMANAYARERKRTENEPELVDSSTSSPSRSSNEPDSDEDMFKDVEDSARDHGSCL